jgi:hypothetical protein
VSGGWWIGISTTLNVNPPSMLQVILLGAILGSLYLLLAFA